MGFVIMTTFEATVQAQAIIKSRHRSAINAARRNRLSGNRAQSANDLEWAAWEREGFAEELKAQLGARLLGVDEHKPKAVK